MAKTKRKVLRLTPDEERRRQLIRHVGEVCFLPPEERGKGSPAWKEPLGKALKISRVSLHWWDTAVRRPPARIEGQLLEFLRRHRKARAKYYAKLAKHDAELAELEREVEQYVCRPA